LEETHTKLQTFLSSASELSVERYTVVDNLSNLIAELTAAEDGAEGQTLLGQMEEMQAELARLEAGLAWASIMEQVLRLRYVRRSGRADGSEEILSPASHHPSPLAALPRYQKLNSLIESLAQRLPSSMTVLGVITGVRESTWNGLREVLSK
jgi:hypothetical protein